MLELAIVGILGYLLLVILLNRSADLEAVKRIPLYGKGNGRPLTSDTVLTIVTWNLGYGGLDSKTDFVADGGQRIRARSHDAVVENVKHITTHLESLTADVFLLQEVAGPSYMNYRVNLKSTIFDALDGYCSAYSSDFKTYLIPPPISVDVGSAFLTRIPTVSTEAILLPLEHYRFLAFRKNYRLLVSRIPVSSNRDSRFLTLVNVHLAAFDAGGKVRQKQLQAVSDFMVQEYEQGNFVVVGGDWNMRLVATDFPHSTDEKHLFWIVDPPKDFPPTNWKIVADDSVPTVRTLHKPYLPGENYTCVVDGFVVSPNIVAVRIETLDLQFAHTDHHPVQLTIEMKD